MMGTKLPHVWEKLSEEYSLIRLNGKIPVEKEWQQFCHRKRTYLEIGFQPGDNAGIACGPASGILVLDVDEPEVFEKVCRRNKWECPISRVHETGSGKYHVIYRYPSNRVYGNKGCKEKYGFDVRGVGGQIVAPGSKHPDTGKPYFVKNHDPIIDPPEWLLSLYEMNGNRNSSSPGIDPSCVLSGIKKGERDETLFRYACRMRECGYPIAEARVLIIAAAHECDPPFSEHEALKKVDNAYSKYESGDIVGQLGTLGDNDSERGQDGGQMGDNVGDSDGDSDGDKSSGCSTNGLAAVVSSYISNFIGTFSTRDMIEHIQSKFGIDKISRQHQKALAKILSRNVDAKKLERTVRGGYRIVDLTLEDLDLGIGAKEHPIKLPLELNKMVYIEPKEVIMVCGNSDAGKTCFALQTGMLNKDIYIKERNCKDNTNTGSGGYYIYHFVSEMGGVSFRNKMENFGPTAYDDYRSKVRVLRFKAESIGDQIQPAAINIIDYLEPPRGDFREVVPTINTIFEKLTTGVAVICVQMRNEFPVGGAGVFWRPRLAVGLLNDKDRNCKVAKIFKGKNNRGDRSIDQWEMDYWVTNRGTNFDVLSDWESPFYSKKRAYTKI